MTGSGGAPDFLAGGGAMGALMRKHDWSSTLLGAPETWPQSLRTSVSICLNCAFPILVWWGPELVKLYNDAYAPILGSKHPAALGAPGRFVWPEIWDVISPMLGRVMTEGVPTRAEDLQLMMHRSGYVEECYFSFSYSPIRDESGVGGVFCPVVETTERVIGERRLRLLRRLAEQTTNLHDEEEVCSTAAACLAEDASRDLPFAAFYLASHKDASFVRLVSATGLEGSTAFPETAPIDTAGTVSWPFAAAGRGAAEAVLVSASSELLSDLPKGP